MGELRDHKFREQWWRRIEADPNPDITDTLLAAAYAISTQARTDGTRALLSIIRLAQILRKNERTARRRVQKLRELGYLELVERGGHRGDGTVAANIYSLSLPSISNQEIDKRDTGEPESDTGISPWADSEPDTYVSSGDFSQQDTQVSPTEEAQPDKSVSQPDKTEAQPDKSTSQPDTQVSAPSFNSSIYPSSNPLAASADADAPNSSQHPAFSRDVRDTATPASQPSIQPGGGLGLDDEFGIGKNKKQDQKRPEEPRCQVRGCGIVKANHTRWMAQLPADQRHDFQYAPRLPRPKHQKTPKRKRR
jgi:hypothetical protein